MVSRRTLGSGAGPAVLDASSTPSVTHASRLRAASRPVTAAASCRRCLSSACRRSDSVRGGGRGERGWRERGHEGRCRAQGVRALQGHTPDRRERARLAEQRAGPWDCLGGSRSGDERVSGRVAVCEVEGGSSRWHDSEHADSAACARHAAPPPPLHSPRSARSVQSPARSRLSGHSKGSEQASEAGSAAHARSLEQLRGQLLSIHAGLASHSPSVAQYQQLPSRSGVQLALKFR
mmetsp:Transcript_20567/g.65530  ORF Transcript_20567/g.65530 Transcript_20567/m.65530 type:complete len:235 (-) Transcript_20567:336-1040(-)